ncbi:MAG: hypothetical protein HRU38_11795 [Saccharospirillaceae bacterium]|nr:hypothetical protein [Pseudomonadales bacterium]NRB79331.1 hypothetical protein [Saccharospirillaceae bacterium]
MSKHRRKQTKAITLKKVQSAVFIEPIEAHKIDSPTDLINQLLSLKSDLENCLPKVQPNIELEYDKNKLKTDRKNVADNPFLSSDSLTNLIFKRQEDEQRFAHELSDLETIGLPLDDAINKHKQMLKLNNQQQQFDDFEQQFQKLSAQIIKQTMEEYQPKVEKIMLHRLNLAAKRMITKQKAPKNR